MGCSAFSHTLATFEATPTTLHPKHSTVIKYLFFIQFFSPQLLLFSSSRAEALVYKMVWKLSTFLYQAHC